MKISDIFCFHYFIITRSINLTLFLYFEEALNGLHSSPTSTASRRASLSVDRSEYCYLLDSTLTWEHFGEA
jgi:hypothetical protein